ncbi:aldolase/citrate lyase family protein [Parapedobacter sp.]|uniref:aldolase/citrate lyase family protein n=1 Tax=Parapedobacter sp. TaxID=1958893 RepID=UPI002D7F054E|nr:aldolase/citrate lyase family protein [Parapedobacter sp.]
MLFAQIEDLEGINQAQAIAAVDGVDVLFVGPADLKMALEASDAEEKPTYGDALQRVSDAANAHGKRSGILVRDQGSLPQLLACGYTVWPLTQISQFCAPGTNGRFQHFSRFPSGEQNRVQYN